MRNEKGYALVFTLLIITVFTILGTAVIGMTITNTKQIHTSEEKLQSIDLAEMGVQYNTLAMDNSLAGIFGGGIELTDVKLSAAFDQFKEDLSNISNSQSFDGNSVSYKIHQIPPEDIMYKSKKTGDTYEGKDALDRIEVIPSNGITVWMDTDNLIIGASFLSEGTVNDETKILPSSLIVRLEKVEGEGGRPGDGTVTLPGGGKTKINFKINRPDDPDVIYNCSEEDCDIKKMDLKDGTKVLIEGDAEISDIQNFKKGGILYSTGDISAEHIRNVSSADIHIEGDLNTEKINNHNSGRIEVEGNAYISDMVNLNDSLLLIGKNLEIGKSSNGSHAINNIVNSTIVVFGDAHFNKGINNNNFRNSNICVFGNLTGIGDNDSIHLPSEESFDDMCGEYKTDVSDTPTVIYDSPSSPEVELDYDY